MFQSAVKRFEELFKKKSKDKITTSVLDEHKMTIEEMIHSKEYPLEIHNVITEDGYMLRCYRIPGGKGEEDYKSKRKQPVLFQHGILDSADGWVCNSEDKCLPYILANSGFDVWLSNSRGTKHSKSHISLNPVSYEFWQFSFHEMGLYDVPAVLEHILKFNTGGEKVIYVGHSQGTCMMFAALTQKLEYFKEKVKLFVALAPVARVGNVKSKLLKVLNTINFTKILAASDQFEVFPNNEENNKFNGWVHKHFTSLTNLMMDMVSDNNSKETNSSERLGVFLTHYPSGTSLKAVNHFVQNFKGKKFCHYDYKKEANMFLYKQTKPLEYDLSVIKDMPIILAAGKEDKLASLEDVRWLNEQIKGNVVYYNEFDDMGHATFMIGKDINWFSDIFEIILKYSIKDQTD
jgi:lysosomal acid lipase/cholesteryl ester hydrolase